jgi:transposase
VVKPWQVTHFKEFLFYRNFLTAAFRLIQSLISTCKLHKINPCVYLTDVLQRISTHPANQVIDLTPRCWKEKFADNPLRSVLQEKDRYVAE